METDILERSNSMIEHDWRRNDDEPEIKVVQRTEVRSPWEPISEAMWQVLCTHDIRFCRGTPPFFRENVFIYKQTKELCLKTLTGYYPITL
ncbi:MAG: hypothetical protein ABI758_01760 [Candidatus Woesebacteria bacterium]